jgi:hypothetical protein
MKPHHETSPLILRDSTIAVRKLNVSSTIATTRITIATTGEVSGSGCCSLWMPS